MTSPEPDEFTVTLARARDLATLLTERHPTHPLYPKIVAYLEQIGGVADARKRYEDLRPLGVVAVRELDGAEGEYQALASAIFHLQSEAWRAAGSPPYEEP